MYCKGVEGVSHVNIDTTGLDRRAQISRLGKAFHYCAEVRVRCPLDWSRKSSSTGRAALGGLLFHFWIFRALKEWS